SSLLHCDYPYALSFSLFYTTTRPPPSSTLFPYTTLFRSRAVSRPRLRVRRPGARDSEHARHAVRDRERDEGTNGARRHASGVFRSEEHTSELQSQSNLVCRLLLEKKKKKSNSTSLTTTIS